MAKFSSSISLEDLFTAVGTLWVFLYSGFGHVLPFIFHFIISGGHCKWNGRTGCWQHLSDARARQPRPCEAPGLLGSIQVSCHLLCSLRLGKLFCSVALTALLLGWGFFLWLLFPTQANPVRITQQKHSKIISYSRHSTGCNFSYENSIG